MTTYDSTALRGKDVNESIQWYVEQLKHKGAKEDIVKLIAEYCFLSVMPRNEGNQSAELLRLEVLEKKLDRKLLQQADDFLREVLNMNYSSTPLNMKLEDAVRPLKGAQELVDMLPPNLLAIVSSEEYIKKNGTHPVREAIGMVTWGLQQSTLSIHELEDAYKYRQ